MPPGSRLEHGVAYHVVQHELGIGDVLCSLYGLNGFSAARGRPPVALYLRDHAGWVRLVDIPGVDVAPAAEPPAGAAVLALGDTAADYREKLRGGHDPKWWYARKLGAAPVRPALRLALFARPPSLPAPYVVLAPFATRRNRTWPVEHWRALATDLAGAGYHVLALDAPGQPERCRVVGVDYYWGQEPAWVANVCRHAALVVAGDSGLAHLGGLLGVRTLVLLAQQIPERYYAMTANAFVVPRASCVGCRFQPERGYAPECDRECHALRSLDPRVVAERALALLAAPHAAAYPCAPPCGGAADA